jgi:hypothetical protein
MTDRLDTLERLREVVAASFDALLDGSPIEADAIYCPRCIAPRRVKVRELKLWNRNEGRRKLADFYPGGLPQLADGPKETVEQRALKKLKEGMAPALFAYECNQCSTKFAAVVYQGPAGDELAVFPSVLGGLSTKHTPPGVAYYQAARAQAAGARSAAVAMYRSALEHLLEEQGYKQKMCGPKITALEDDLTTGKARKWAQDVDPEVMRTPSCAEMRSNG